MLVFWFLFCVAVAGAQDIREDVELFTRLFPGLYDNLQQYESDIAQKLTKNRRHVHLTIVIVEQQVALFSKTRNFYIKQYVNGNKSHVIRQKLYTVTIHSGDLLMKIYSFRRPSQVLHAPPNASVFADLQVDDDLLYIDGCDVSWRRTSCSPLVFENLMTTTCLVTLEGLGQVMITELITLSEMALTVWEKWTLTNGTAVNSYDSPYVLLRQPTDHGEQL